MQCKPAKQKFVAGTSRGPRNVATLLAQMADLERGGRIKELRDRQHLTQPVVADRVGVTLRAYQEWEAGGGIQWENAKRLAKALNATPDFIMGGIRPETPDLSLEPSQLDRIEAMLKQQQQAIDELCQEIKTRAGQVLERLSSPPPSGSDDAFPAPPGELGRRTEVDRTKDADQRQGETQAVEENQPNAAG